MSERGKNVVTAAFYTGVGIGLVYIFGKYRKDILNGIKKAWNFRDPLKNLDVRIINSVDECRDVVQQLKL